MNTILYVGEHQRTFDVPWHSHEHWEIVYCTGGEGAFRVENGPVIPYHMGQAVAIPPGQLHMNSSVKGFTNIHMNLEDPAFPYKSAFLVDDNAQGHIAQAFSQARYYYLSDLRREEVILAALGELIAGYMTAFRDNREFSIAVEHIRATIQRNYSNPAFELDREISQMPFNYDYLRKLFQKEMGLTPLKYMIDLRMKKAKSMLSAGWTGEYSVAEVAESCGFSDALYFSRVFKKYHGCSPSDFVKQRRGEG